MDHASRRESEARCQSDASGELGTLRMPLDRPDLSLAGFYARCAEYVRVKGTLLELPLDHHQRKAAAAPVSCSPAPMYHPATSTPVKLILSRAAAGARLAGRGFLLPAPCVGRHGSSAAVASCRTPCVVLPKEAGGAPSQTDRGERQRESRAYSGSPSAPKVHTSGPPEELEWDRGDVRCPARTQRNPAEHPAAVPPRSDDGFEANLFVGSGASGRGQGDHGTPAGGCRGGQPGSELAQSSVSVSSRLQDDRIRGDGENGTPAADCRDLQQSSELAQSSVSMNFRRNDRTRSGRGQGENATDLQQSTELAQSSVSMNSRRDDRTRSGRGQGENATDLQQSTELAQSSVSMNSRRDDRTRGGRGQGENATDLQQSTELAQSSVSMNSRRDDRARGGRGQGENATDLQQSTELAQSSVSMNSRHDDRTRGGRGRAEHGPPANNCRDLQPSDELAQSSISMNASSRHGDLTREGNLPEAIPSPHCAGNDAFVHVESAPRCAPVVPSRVLNEPYDDLGRRRPQSGAAGAGPDGFPSLMGGGRLLSRTLPPRLSSSRPVRGGKHTRTFELRAAGSRDWLAAQLSPAPAPWLCCGHAAPFDHTAATRTPCNRRFYHSVASNTVSYVETLPAGRIVPRPVTPWQRSLLRSACSAHRSARARATA